MLSNVQSEATRRPPAPAAPWDEAEYADDDEEAELPTGAADSRAEAIATALRAEERRRAAQAAQEERPCRSVKKSQTTRPIPPEITNTLNDSPSIWTRPGVAFDSAERWRMCVSGLVAITSALETSAP